MTLISKILRRKPAIAVLRLDGVIGASGRFGSAGLSDAGLAPLVEKAFRRLKPKAVALAINSPGGSPAQSSLIAARIRRLAEELEIPVYAFCEDVAASGGYWLATAADEIYVDENSVMGSIGVISASFGFQELMAKHGIERRVHTAGEDKSMGDPFRAQKPKDVKRLKALQAQIHENFIAQVKQRRGSKLADQDLFTGEVWIGKAAVENGLADGVGHLIPVMQEKFGPKIRFVSLAKRKSLFSRFGMSAGQILDEAEMRALWSRFGL